MSSSGKKHQVYMVSPPPLFTYLDRMEKIINFSGKKLDSSVSELCSSVSLSVQDVNINDQDFPRSSISKFNEWLNIQVVDIISQSIAQSIVIFGSVDNHISSLIVACIRRQSDWSLVSIFAEFRHFTWPFKMRDYEQLIENYSPTIIEAMLPVETSFNAKRWDNENEESRNEIEGNSTSLLEIGAIESSPILHEINNNLRALFVSSSSTLISKHCSFDPSLSLVNDKDDDD